MGVEISLLLFNKLNNWTKKKAITCLNHYKSLQANLPTVDNWLEIEKAIHEMERLTFLLRSTYDLYVARWTKWNICLNKGLVCDVLCCVSMSCGVYYEAHWTYPSFLCITWIDKYKLAVRVKCHHEAHLWVNLSSQVSALVSMRVPIKRNASIYSPLQNG